MNRAERLSADLDLMAGSGQLEVGDMMTKLGDSVATARRDLDSLASQQLLICARADLTQGALRANLDAFPVNGLEAIIA